MCIGKQRKPEEEEPTEVKVHCGYSAKNPPKAPKGYKLVEIKATKYGYWYLKYVVEPPKDPRRSGGKIDRSTHRLD